MKIKILTDTSCGILRNEITSMDVEMIALPFVLDEKEYDDDSISKSEFYEKLKEAKTIHTSQCSLEKVMDAFDRILKEYDHIIYLPITSGLSSAYANAICLLDEDKYKGKVTIIDHKTISVLQRELILDIKKLIDKGLTPDKIKTLVEKNAKNHRIYIAVDTLDYLKKGGRVSALSATLGNILNIKPILFSDGGKFTVIKKARGIKGAEEEIKNIILKDLNGIFKGEAISDFSIGVAYTKDIDEASKFKRYMEETVGQDVIMDELPSVVGCHIGEGAVASAIYKHVNEN